jgi:hypothetical protein
MKQFTCRFNELDEETQQYLRQVYKLGGKRCPGVYLEFPPGPHLEKIALGVGPILMLVAVIWAANSTKSAYAVAMLFAGLMMLGGWLTWFGLRGAFRSDASLVEHFVYFDPTHVYEFNSDDIVVTDISDFSKVKASSNGGLPQLVFANQDQTYAISVSNTAKAQYIEQYYFAILDLEEHEDTKWSKLDEVERGGVAKHIVTEGGYPISVESARLKVTELPQRPQRERSSVPGLGLLVSYTAAIVLFLLGLAVFKSMRDNSAFATAQATGAPGLRGYLLDDRNVLHREEAQKLLAALYAPVVSKVSAGVPDRHVQIREALVALVESLKTAPQPVVSLQVIETGMPANPSDAEGRTRVLREGLADALGLYFGHELIAFAKNPDDKKAHFEVTYTVAANQQLKWKLGVRTTPDSPVTETKVFTTSHNGNIPDTIKGAIFLELFQTSVPVIPPPVFDDGW